MGLLIITEYNFPTTARPNEIITNAFSMKIYASTTVPSCFCGFMNKSGNPGAIEINIPGVGWSSIEPGQRFVANLGTIQEATSELYGPRDLKFTVEGEYDIEIFTGHIVDTEEIIDDTKTIKTTVLEVTDMVVTINQLINLMMSLMMLMILIKVMTSAIKKPPRKKKEAEK